MSFNDDFFKDFDRSAKKGVAGFAGLGCLAVILNLLFWLALIAGALFLLTHFGVL